MDVVLQPANDSPVPVQYRAPEVNYHHNSEQFVISTTHESGSDFQLGTTVVSASATGPGAGDGASITVTCTFTVTILGQCPSENV